MLRSFLLFWVFFLRVRKGKEVVCNLTILCVRSHSMVVVTLFYHKVVVKVVGAASRLEK